MRRSQLKQDDLLFSIAGTLGRTAVVENKDLPANTNQALAIVRLNSENTMRFIYFFLNLPKIKRRVYQILSVGAQPNLSLEQVGDFKISLPSLPEQQKIADFLTVVDEKIGKSEEKKKGFEKYKKGAVQAIFSQKIRLKPDGENLAPRSLGEAGYPDWEEKKLYELEEEKQIILGRGEVISKEDIKNTPGDYPIYSSSVKRNGLFGKYGKYMFDEELITWSIDGGGHLFYRPKHKYSVTNVCGWLRVVGDSVNCNFLAKQLQYLHERKIFDYQMKAHPSVIRKMYKLNTPVLEEQEKIADFLTALDNKINLINNQLKQAKLFKKSLLQRMFV